MLNQSLHIIFFAIFFCAYANCEDLLKNTCHENDTSWNKNNIGAQIRRWLDTLNVDVGPMKTPADYHIAFIPNVRTIKSDDPQKRLDIIAKLNENTGVPIGKAWKSFGHKGSRFHDGFLYGTPNSKMEFTGKNIAWIYPDFETVLIGEFFNGTMIAAKQSKILAERCKNGIKELKFAKPKKNAPTFKFERPNHLRIGDQPTIPDPLESKNIYIADGIMQDGVFARRDIARGELVCYYSGMIFNPKVNPVFYRNQTNSEK